MAKSSKGSLFNKTFSSYPSPMANQGAPQKGVDFSQDVVEIKSGSLAGVGSDARPHVSDMDNFGFAKKVLSSKPIDGDAARHKMNFGPAPVESV